MTINALRRIQDEEQPDVPRHPAPVIPHRAGRAPATARPATDSTPAEPIAATAADTEQLSVGALLAWAREHDDKTVRVHASRATESLGILRTRHAADTELAVLEAEEARLSERLAELAARRAQLAPKTARKSSSRRPDYDPAEVRAWARENGRDVAPRGLVPRDVVDAWRAAH